MGVKVCPLCHGESGYQRIKQIRVITYTGWDGDVQCDDIDEVMYQGKILKCQDCGEKVGSWHDHTEYVIPPTELDDFVEPDDDPGPIEDRDCEYWNRIT